MREGGRVRMFVKASVVFFGLDEGRGGRLKESGVVMAERGGGGRWVRAVQDQGKKWVLRVEGNVDPVSKGDGGEQKRDTH